MASPHQVTPEDSMFSDSMSSAPGPAPTFNVEVEYVDPADRAARDAARALANMPFDLQGALLICGCGTLAVLFLAWAVPRFTFFFLDRITGAAPMVACDPPPTPEARAAAWRQVVLNWLLVAIPVVMASPAVWYAFPYAALSPVWWQIVLLYIGSLFMHDVLGFIDRNFIGTTQRLFRMVTNIPKLLQGPFAWGGRCVHPVEMYYQVLDMLVVPAMYSLCVQRLLLYVWWGWLAILQLMWVLERSNYAPSQATTLLEMLGLQKKKPRKSTANAKQGAKAIVREAAKKKDR